MSDASRKTFSEIFLKSFYAIRFLFLIMKLIDQTRQPNPVSFFFKTIPAEFFFEF